MYNPELENMIIDMHLKVLRVSKNMDAWLSFVFSGLIATQVNAYLMSPHAWSKIFAIVNILMSLFVVVRCAFRFCAAKEDIRILVKNKLLNCDQIKNIEEGLYAKTEKD